jgi:hypothetical protein
MRVTEPLLREIDHVSSSAVLACPAILLTPAFPFSPQTQPSGAIANSVSAVPARVGIVHCSRGLQCPGRVGLLSAIADANTNGDTQNTIKLARGTYLVIGQQIHAVPAKTLVIVGQAAFEMDPIGPGLLWMSRTGWPAPRPTGRRRRSPLRGSSTPTIHRHASVFLEKSWPLSRLRDARSSVKPDAEFLTARAPL